MDWIDNYHLFLFDFDGLLVNTEDLHLEAYRLMCLEHGLELDLDAATYAKVAQFDSTGPSKAIYAKFPHLQSIPWETLRKRKNEIYLEMIGRGEVELMEGADLLLKTIQAKNIPHCVVTHSKPEQIAPIREKYESLRAIPCFITRFDYNEPKPHPEGYLKALSHFNVKGPVIGFEDSPKGLQALLDAGVDGVMVNPHFTKEEILPLVKRDFFHFNDLREVLRVPDLIKKETFCRSG